MELRDYLRIFRRRKWVYLAVVVVCVGLAYGQTRLAMPIYQSRARVFVGQGGGGGGIASGVAAVQLSQQLVESYAQIATSRPLLQEVSDSLGGTLSTDALRGKVAATPVSGTLLIDITVSDTDAARAASIANTLADVFVREVTELQSTGPSGRPVLEVRVIERGIEPYSPISPKPRLNIALGLLVGIILGALATLFADHLDQSLKDPEEAQQALGVPFLGSVPKFRRRTSRLVSAEAESRSSEAIRIVRTNLRFASLPTSARRFLITSPSAGEGKTTLAANLALALSQGGDRVVLLETDLRRPTLAELFSLSPSPGLTDLLLGEVALMETSRRIEGSNLIVIPAGARPPNPAELLGSPQMSQLMDRLGELSDVVLLDSPPLLPVADSAILASLCDGVVVVLRYAKTERGSAQKARQVLTKAGSPTLGFVMNVIPTKPSYSYYHYYDYRYQSPKRNGRGGSHAGKRKEPAPAQGGSIDPGGRGDFGF